MAGWGDGGFGGFPPPGGFGGFTQTAGPFGQQPGGRGIQFGTAARASAAAAAGPLGGFPPGPSLAAPFAQNQNAPPVRQQSPPEAGVGGGFGGFGGGAAGMAAQGSTGVQPGE